MAQLTTKNVVEQARDVSEQLNIISPDKTPVYSIMGSRSVNNNDLMQWYETVYPDGNADNAHYEGADVTNFDAGTQPSKLGNRCQISMDTLEVSDSMVHNKNVEARKDELARHLPSSKSKKSSSSSSSSSSSLNPNPYRPCRQCGS